MLISQKPCKIERFRRNFWPTGYICRVAMPIFKKILSRQKWRPFWIFEFFAKIAKHKNAYISKTLLDRAISTKFLTHRVSLQSSHANFQTKNFSQIFEFFAKIAKHKNAYISKTLLDRAISTKFLTHRVSLQSSHANFQTKNFSQKMAAFSNFSQNCKAQKCIYLENRAR